MSEGQNDLEETLDDKQLKNRLQENGLDPEHWLKEIKKLKIKNIHALQYIQAEDCSCLETKSRHDWEKRALRKLFAIPDSSAKMAEIQETQAHILKVRKEQRTKQLEELKLKSEGKSLQDEVLFRKVEEMQKLLEIPTKSSVPPDKTLGDLVDYFDKQNSLRVEASLKVNNFTDEEVIRNASGGLALKGIFPTKNNKKLYKKRETLLCVPQDFQLLGPEEMSYFRQKKFTSRKEENCFRKTIEKGGFSFSNSAVFGFKGFGLSYGVDISKSSASETSTSSSEDRTYVCTTRCNYVPLASYYFTKNQMRLTQDALGELKEIEKLLLMKSDTQILRTKCEEFFQRFGSHANLGPIHLGGIFCWKASMEGVHKNKMNEAKTSTGEALNSFMNGSYAGIAVDISNTKASGSADKSKVTQSNEKILLSVTKTGGPPEADSLPHWKAGLVSSNKSWSVIDRGFQLIPIWKIIVANHQREFTDVVQLSSCLMESYKLLTGLNSEVMVGEQLQIAYDEAQLFMEGVKSWAPDNAQEHLKDLLGFKQKNNKLTKSDSTWLNVCLSDKSLQAFLVKVAEKSKDDFSIDTDIIKGLMRELIIPHIYSFDDFPKASVLIKWIKSSEKDKLYHIDIHDFTQLINVLQKSMDDVLDGTVDLRSEDVKSAKILATINISLSLYSFLKMMRETDQTDVELLILCIAMDFGYCAENHNFRRLLGHKEIEFLKNQLEKAYEEYTNLRKQRAEWAQAFVLYSGLTSVGQNNKISSCQKRDSLNFMRTHLRNSICPEVDNLLNHNSGNWELVEGNLRAFINGQTLQEEVYAKDLTNQLSCLYQKEILSTENAVIVDISNTREDIQMLLKDLVLQNYYLQKMKNTDFHIISTATLSGAQPVENRELPIYFLQKLLVLDYGARYVHCETKSEESQANTRTIIINNNNNNNNTISSSGNLIQTFFCRNRKLTEEQKAKQIPCIHPMDVQMAIFHCADDFMRQYIYTKLSLCQFALPLLVPNPNTRSMDFQLWAFQEVKKKWKIKHGNDIEKSKTNDKFIKDTETPIVSFIRLGPSDFSKSQTINWLMNKHRHDIFYHRHCEGSTRNTILMDGVADIAWYCPGGREDDVFDDCIAFINLHGDARDHGQQLEFIEQISSVLVIVLTDSDWNDDKSKNILNQLLVTTKPCAFLLVDTELSDSDTPHKLQIGIKGKNEAELVKEVRSKIQDLALLQKETYSLNKCAAVARHHGFPIDEDKEQCKVGKEQAEKLLKLLKTEELSAMKKTFLPLQGDLWKQWCKKDKELFRLGGKSNLSIEQQRSDIESKKEALRREQLKRAIPLNNFMKDLLQFLNSNEQGLQMYFLQWLKTYLDELSSKALCCLNEKYHNLWSRVKKEKRGGKNKQTIDTLEKKLQEVLNQINLSTFGLEHVLREMGQIYEALEANNENQNIGSLPKIAANLMIWGYPIELMDGDAAHVPLKWITAILHEVKDALGDIKLFVLSVLGVQSSGKSTLLNAMFGLQFAVSAGRCTRGAFMQLVKVEEQLRNEMTYDYVLVVDTEGLRSTELSNKNVLNHDNELATFVIGLGNLTLINILGENPSEMQDILQIVVQAFLRMKKVDLHPSCLFVHQNVGEITAKEKNLEGRRCLQSKLDEITLCAAEQEKCDVTCFNDVIEFDVDTHIHYFSHLWEGDPPMAPPNRRYSQNVQSLRKIILDCGKVKDNILSISAFRARVTDLWNALLNENFVFSFRNSLEISAYNLLEEKYSHWAWKLRERMLTHQNEITNQIRKEEIKSIDPIYISEKLNDIYSKVQNDLKEFFNEAKNKNILIQWRANTEKRIYSIKEDLIQEIKKKAKDLISFKEKNREIDGMKAKYEDDIFVKSKELALSLKGQNLTDKDLEDKFIVMWNCWISAVSEDLPLLDIPDIHQDLDEILQEQFKKEVNITNTICESKHWENLTEEFSKFVSSHKKYMVFKKSLSDKKKNKINDSIDVLNGRIDDYIDKKEQEKMDYQSSYFHEILNIIREDLNTRFPKKFRFLADFIVYVSLFLCRKAAHRFEKLSAAYRKVNNPVNYLASKRAEFYQSYKVSCEEKLEVASLADIISNKLKVSFQEAVNEESAINMCNDMKCNHTALNGNRSKLEFCLLKSLAEKESFQDYLTYFTDPKLAVKEFIRDCIEDHMRDTSTMSGFLHTNMAKFKNITLNAIKLTTVKIKQEKGNVDSWLDAFCSGLGNKLNLSRDDLRSVKYQNISDIDFLKEAMTRAMDTAVQMLCEEISTCDMSGLKERILGILTDNFTGCWEQCPFCGAVCTNTIPQHSGDHSVKYHRPEGLRGWRWIRTQLLVTNICTSLVSSDVCFLHDGKWFPHKHHKEAGPPYSNWSITPDNSSLSYWKWVTCRFQSDIEKRHDRKFVKIPDQWKNISKADAISEIEKCS